MGALLAFIPLVLYMTIPWVIDRFDPEPWWCLALALLWGALAACGFAAAINTAVLVGSVQRDERRRTRRSSRRASAHRWSRSSGRGSGSSASSSSSDASSTGSSTASSTPRSPRSASLRSRTSPTTRARSLTKHGSMLAGHVLHPRRARAVGAPALHVDDGARLRALARDDQAVAPLGRAASSATWAPCSCTLRCGTRRPEMSGMALVPHDAPVLAHVQPWRRSSASSFGSWHARGRIIRDNLKDEVLARVPLGSGARRSWPRPSWAFQLKAGMSHGSLGREFVGAASRLGLSKWHTARAMRGQKRTVSADWIAPLRAELGELRQRLTQQAGRPLVPGPGPIAWADAADARVRACEAGHVDDEDAWRRRRLEGRGR